MAKQAVAKKAAKKPSRRRPAPARKKPVPQVFVSFVARIQGVDITGNVALNIPDLKTMDDVMAVQHLLLNSNRDNGWESVIVTNWKMLEA